MWSLVGLSAGGSAEGGLPWAQHPLGRAMVEGILAHYSRLRDIQTVAVLSAVLAPALPAAPGREGRKGALVARAAEEERRVAADSCLLDPATAPTTDLHLRLYADLLYCWGLLTPRTELLKCLTASEEESQRADIAMSCTHCSNPSSGPACTSCRSPTGLTSNLPPYCTSPYFAANHCTPAPLHPGGCSFSAVSAASPAEASPWSVRSVATGATLVTSHR